MKNLQISERRLELREKFEKKNRFLQWLIPVKCRSLQKEEKKQPKTWPLFTKCYRISHSAAKTYNQQSRFGPLFCFIF